MHSSPSAAPTGELLRQPAWKVNARVVGALLMREMLTRYGRNNIGFLWLFAEPMLFVLVVAILWKAFRTIHGSDIPIVAFAVTGYSALLLWRNTSARGIDALKSNRSLLYHRQVTILDVYYARLFLEVMAATTSFVVLSVGLYAMDWLPAPEDAFQVLGGWLFLAWFGIALGLTIAALSEKADVVGKLWSPFSWLLMPFSGVAFVVHALPPKMQEIVLWLPMLNALEFLREGWFGSHFTPHYDIPYLITFNMALSFVGLSLARQVGTDTGDQ
jgi:ABC-type polysaccharide/polyol phosphate export permease